MANILAPPRQMTSAEIFITSRTHFGFRPSRRGIQLTNSFLSLLALAPLGSAKMWSLHGKVLLYSISSILLTLPKILARSSSGGWKRVSFVPSNPPPTIRVYGNDPNFPVPRATGERLQQAWLDMWHLAAVACVTLDDEEDVYKRYFEPGDSVMVQRKSSPLH